MEAVFKNFNLTKKSKSIKNRRVAWGHPFELLHLYYPMDHKKILLINTSNNFNWKKERKKKWERETNLR